MATVPEIRGLLEVVLPRITSRSPQDLIAWFMKQRHNKEKSRNSYKKKWLKNYPA
jgi:hypothetical protein